MCLYIFTHLHARQCHEHFSKSNGLFKHDINLKMKSKWQIPWFCVWGQCQINIPYDGDNGEVGRRRRRRGHYRGGDWSEKIGNYWGSRASRGAFSVGKQNLKEPKKIYWLWNCSLALEEQEDQAALWIYMIKKDWYFILMCLNFSICHQHYCKFKCGAQQ